LIDWRAVQLFFLPRDAALIFATSGTKSSKVYFHFNLVLG
jgi:hypothetical protein